MEKFRDLKTDAEEKGSNRRHIRSLESFGPVVPAPLQPEPPELDPGQAERIRGRQARAETAE